MASIANINGFIMCLESVKLSKKKIQRGHHVVLSGNLYGERYPILNIGENQTEEALITIGKHSLVMIST
jgi:hypothetical protein